MPNRINLKKLLLLCINTILLSLSATYDKDVHELKVAIDLDFDQILLGETFRKAFELYQLENMFDLSNKDKKMLRSYLTDRARAEWCKLDREFKNHEIDNIQLEGARVLIEYTQNRIDELLL